MRKKSGRDTLVPVFSPVCATNAILLLLERGSHHNHKVVEGLQLGRKSSSQGIGDNNRIWGGVHSDRKSRKGDGRHPNLGVSLLTRLN